ncbi:MAG: copper chaperone PCu(A)C [Thiohalomonadaceae bacterium]
MMKSMRVLALLCGGLLVSLANAAEVMVENPWIREAPPAAAALGAFMVLHNHADKPMVLVGAETAVANEVQLHRTVIENDTAKMIHQTSIEIPSHGSLEFKPGDYHLMLMKPKQVLKAGEQVEITLQFEDGSRVPASFEVRSGMGMPMDHGSMHHH